MSRSPLCAEGRRNGSGGEVRSLVTSARRAASTARLVESVFAALAAFLLTLSAAVLSGARLDAVDAWAAALLAGLAAGVGWFLELRPEERRLAKRLDVRLAQDGRLLTAFEAEMADSDSELARLLSHRVRSSIRGSDALRAALPRSFPVCALPFLAASVLALTLEGRRTPPFDKGRVTGAVHGFVSELREAQDQALAAIRDQELHEEELESVMELHDRARSLAASVEGGELPSAEEFADMTRELEELERSVPPESELAESLERAALIADGLSMTVEKEPRGQGPSAEGASGAEGLREGGPSDPSGENGEGAPGEGALASATGEETGEDSGGSSADTGGSSADKGDKMSTTSSPDAAESTESPAGVPAELARKEPEARDPGVASAGPWPERHAGVVARWVELRRDRLARGGEAESEDE